MFAARLKTQIQITSLRHNFGLYFLGSVKLIERNFVFADCHWHAIQLQLNINKGYLLDYYFSRIEKCICYWFVRIPAWLDLSHLSAASFIHSIAGERSTKFILWGIYSSVSDGKTFRLDLMMFFLNMMDYPMSFLLLSTWDLPDKLGGTFWAFLTLWVFFVGPLLHAWKKWGLIPT